MSDIDLKKIVQREYVECSKNPIHFMKKYCTIQHPQRGKIKFKLYPFQYDVLKEYEATIVLEDDIEISEIISEVFDLTPYGITNTLDLLNRKYQPTAAFGHFGRSGDNFTWEHTNKIDILKERV